MINMTKERIEAILAQYSPDELSSIVKRNLDIAGIPISNHGTPFTGLSASDFDDFTIDEILRDLQ